MAVLAVTLHYQCICVERKRKAELQAIIDPFNFSIHSVSPYMYW